MAADSDGCADLTTVVTCEGNLADPEFQERFQRVVSNLNGILGETVKVHKLEPWNSVRVTLSIPREAALRLRKLASEGSAQLRALGILSVQVEGDQVISLRIANALNAEPQEILIQTTQDGAGTSDGALARFLTGPPVPPPATVTSKSPSEKVQFKSPNVVCPADSVVPKVPPSATITAPTTNNTTTTPPATKSYAGPFPFTSMNQAIHSREPTYTAPPPPYPGKHHSNPAVTISSPLLVNLLQNDAAPKAETVTSAVKLTATSLVVANRTVPSSFVNNKQAVLQSPPPPPPPPPPPVNRNRGGQQQQQPRISPPSISLEPDMSMNTNKTVASLHQLPKKSPQAIGTSSPSALSNTSIRQNNSSIPPTSTMSNHVNFPSTSRNLAPPPPYTVAVNRQWDAVVQSAFFDLTPTLTDLKADDLDDLLPTLERDLTEMPEERARSALNDKRNFLINPLTGELEPQSSGGESEVEDLGDVFTGLPSPAALSDDDTNSTIRPDTTDQSDSETRSSHSDSGKHSRSIKSKVRDRGRDSPLTLKPTEKIKLRLKLEKSEPVNSGYKVDVSFIQQPKKATSSIVTSQTSEELRVPPLHISLRGKHHAFITNKKKAKLNPDKVAKPRKTSDAALKLKKEGGAILMAGDEPATVLLNNTSDALVDTAKKKKFKPNHEHNKDLAFLQNSELISKLVAHKDKQKERRVSDSELNRTNNMKLSESNGLSGEKKRRLSQSEMALDLSPAVLGSTNVGTIAGLPQKSRKDKTKIKDGFKVKDLVMKNKGFKGLTGEKFVKQVALPTGEIDMEAKFKQRLMEGSEKGIPRPPHRTDGGGGGGGGGGHVDNNRESSQIEMTDKKPETEPPPSLKEKSPEPDKCNTPDRKPSSELGDKQSGRSPNSGAQGEDSGIESMDALSEKSPNQASQSPHADIPEVAPPSSSSSSSSIKSKTQVPDMLDIEAELAKMEGLNGVEDLNENNQHAGNGNKTVLELGQCCELTSALQDSLKQGTVTLSVNTKAAMGAAKEQIQQNETSLMAVKVKTKVDSTLEPLPVRVTPPLYTYSNPDKGRSPGSPPMSDDEEVEAASTLNQHKRQSLLEQLLIEIPPDNQTPSSPSPATRSVRTRALSKLSSPELNSPVTKQTTTTTVTRSTTPAAVVQTAKRKRHESDSVEDALRNKKPRKCSENAVELIKACMGVDPAAKMNHVKKMTAGKLQDESSDSDEPLIEKVRKTTNNSNNVAKGTKVKTTGNSTVKNVVSTRRSVRTTAPAPNTRSKGDKGNLESEALRRKTRSAVSDVDNKRKKEVK